VQAIALFVLTSHRSSSSLKIKLLCVHDDDGGQNMKRRRDPDPYLSVKVWEASLCGEFFLRRLEIAFYSRMLPTTQRKSL
jgi:hypothetical protein